MSPIKNKAVSSTHPSPISKNSFNPLESPEIYLPQFCLDHGKKENSENEQQNLTPFPLRKNLNQYLNNNEGYQEKINFKICVKPLQLVNHPHPCKN